jgi:hypothetical protein
MKIKIKRARNEGLEECEGIFLEINGYQFCFTEVEEEGYFYLIELSTGGNAKAVDSFDCTIRQALDLVKEKINSLTKENIDIGIERFKKKYSQFSYPVNEPIK